MHNITIFVCAYKSVIRRSVGFDKSVIKRSVGFEKRSHHSIKVNNISLHKSVKSRKAIHKLPGLKCTSII